MIYRSMSGVVTACGLLLIASAAQAADVLAVMKAPAAAVAPSWSGFYMGLHAGLGFANGNATSRTDIGGGGPFAPASFDLDDSGVLFGAQIGYNWQFGNWVLGVEGDISGAGLSGFESQVPVQLTGPGGPAFSADSFMRQDVNWLATARARLGHAWGSGLLYVTGGAAWANIDYQANISEALITCGGTGCSVPAKFGDTRSGWVIGGGYEWAAASNWTLRGEYLFYSFDGPSTTVSAVTSGGPCPTCHATYSWGDLDIHAVRLGLNYKWDGAVSAQMPKQTPFPAASGRTGFYAGLHGGWAFARGDATSTTAINLASGSFHQPASFDLDDNGPMFGAQIGYNWQSANWVLGVEADLTGAGIRGFQSQTPNCVLAYCAFSGPVFGEDSFMRQDVDWLASLRGRLGHVWGAGMIYVTGGAAFAHVDYEAKTTGRVACGNSPGCAFPAAFSKTRSGWVIGGGYEWPAWSNWTLRGEYLFYSFDGVSATVGPAPAASGNCLAGCSVTYRWNDLDIHALRVGLNYTW